MEEEEEDEDKLPRANIAKHLSKTRSCKVQPDQCKKVNMESDYRARVNTLTCLIIVGCQIIVGLGQIPKI